MTVTRKEIISLIKLTAVDCPLPSVADMLETIGPGDSEAKTMFNFIKSHYTREQMRDGINKYTKRVKLMQQLFSLSQQSNQQS